MSGSLATGPIRQSSRLVERSRRRGPRAATNLITAGVGANVRERSHRRGPRAANLGRRPQERVALGVTARRSAARRRRRVLVVAWALLGSTGLLATVAANAVVLTGQARLERLDQELTSQTIQRQRLELEVANELAPQRVAGAQGSGGATMSTRIVDVPEAAPLGG
jgi:hypothetical protein